MQDCKQYACSCSGDITESALDSLSGGRLLLNQASVITKEKLNIIRWLIAQL